MRIGSDDDSDGREEAGACWLCLLLALQWGGAEYAWSNSRIIGLFVGFGLLIAVFIGIQFWKGDQGTLPPRLFKNRYVLFAMLFCLGFGAGFFSLIYYLCKRICHCLTSPPFPPPLREHQALS